VQAERDKLLKKAGKKSKELEEKWGPIPVEHYEYLSEEVFRELLLARLAAPDCNAGAMFDDIRSKWWPNEVYALKCVMEAVGT
jgi:hydrocephalus-inducing protein